MTSTPPDAPYAAYVAVMGGAPPDMRREPGYFNVLAVQASVLPPPPREFKRLGFYKISLTHGSGCLEFADQRQQVGPRFLFLATPGLLYRWTPAEPAYTGRSCIFSDEFLLPAKGGVLAQALPIFQPGAHPVIELTAADCQRVEAIF